MDSKSAVLGLMNEENNVLGSVQQLNADIISKIKTVISSSLVSRQAVFEDHVENMLITQISDVLRTLLVREWRGHREESYRNFLPESMDYISETINFETSGYFSSDLGDLMPIAMANVLRMPIVIVTSESHTPLISVCPEETILYSTPLFLAYNRLGAGHYDAAVSMLTCKLKIKL